MKYFYTLVASILLLSQTISPSLAQAQETAKIKLRSRTTVSSHNGTDPLIVIDGEVMAERKIRDISPEDIERIEVLKGVSATAIYGTRGSNGVIIIYTKGWRKKKSSSAQAEKSEMREEMSDDELEENIEDTELVLYPNPVSDILHLRFSLSSSQQVKAVVYGVDGRIIDTAFDGILDAGRYDESWNSSSLEGGIYFLRVAKGDEVEVIPFMVK